MTGLQAGRREHHVRLGEQHGFQHSPANMGYFALWMAETGQGPGWATALGWNIIPAGIGNMVGAAVLVALPFWYVYRPSAS